MPKAGQLAGRIHAPVDRKQFDRVADGVLYPAFGLLPSPAFVGAAMALSLVPMVTNALRLNRIRL
jgi:hypothetical protein